MEENEKYDLLPGIEDDITERENKIDHRTFESLDEGRIPTPVPFRVKSGIIEKSRLVLHTSSKVLKVPWEDVEVIALGIIVKVHDTGNAPQSNMRKIIGRLFLGKQESVEKLKASTDVYIIDLFIKGYEAPFRVDPTNVNYKSFLQNPGLVSNLNFKRLVKKIVYFAKKSLFNPCIVAYVENNKEDLEKSATIADFELKCQKLKANREELIPRDEIIVEPEKSWESAIEKKQSDKR